MGVVALLSFPPTQSMTLLVFKVKVSLVIFADIDELTQIDVVKSLQTSMVNRLGW